MHCDTQIEFETERTTNADAEIGHLSLEHTGCIKHNTQWSEGRDVMTVFLAYAVFEPITLKYDIFLLMHKLIISFQN